MNALPPAPLEDWLRDHYFTAEINICSSGVEPYSFKQLRSLATITDEELDGLVFDDGYSYGAPLVREAVAQRWSDGAAGKVMTTCGSSEAIALSLDVLLRGGDEVIVVEPGYHSLTGFAEARGCQVSTWRLDIENSSYVQIEELIALITSSTRAIIVNFPHNPTGISITSHDMKRLLNAADRVGAYVLWDTAFFDLCYESPRLPDPTTLYERAISVGTMS